MKDWNINTRVHPGLAHPSNLLTKFGHPDLWFEEVALTGTQNRGAVVTNPVCSIMSLSIEAIHKLLMSKYITEGCNVAYLPSKPPLTQGLHLEFLLKEVDNLPELTLGLILIILEPISCIIVLVNIQVKDIVTRVDPWSAEKEKFMSSMVDKLFTCASATIHIFVICICRWRIMVNPLTFGPGMTRAVVPIIVVGDISKLASKTVHFSLSSVFVDLILLGKLRNAIT